MSVGGCIQFVGDSAIRCVPILSSSMFNTVDTRIDELAGTVNPKTLPESTHGCSLSGIFC